MVDHDETGALKAGADGREVAEAVPRPGKDVAERGGFKFLGECFYFGRAELIDAQ